ncbi:uncharacterized protein LOC105391900 isoform X1 [Plutella xylostella]|uniref:uncharacterized protein LOC105391900 isoform X1 n=1 Tax=Plutella xylostella TaxID=51655 RepID=UPI002032C756|nr:uncharacterized protein LOC105391900 isoform X1 [Plutella xylostella]
MTQSPKKYVSHYTSSTKNRGVQAKEIELASTHLIDMNSTQRTESFTASMGDHAPLERAVVPDVENPSPTDTARGTDESGSFIQVVVHKHHQKKESQPAAAQTSPRLPAASSPITKMEHPSKDPQVLAGCGDGPAPGPPPAPGVYMLPPPLLLTYPGMAQQLDGRDGYSWYPGRRTLVEVSTSAQSSTSFKKHVRAARPVAPTRKAKVPPPTGRAAGGAGGDMEDDGPVVIFYFISNTAYFIIPYIRFD